MKIRCFHKYLSVNFFICLILVTAFLYYRYYIRNLSLAYCPEAKLIDHFVVYHLHKIVSINALAILVEHILTKTGIIKKNCDVIQSKPFRIFVYVLTTILFLLYVIFVSALYLFIIIPTRMGLLND